MTKEEILKQEESLIDRKSIAPYKPIELKALAKHFVPKLSKLIPNFVFKKLNKLLHIYEFNYFFNKSHYGTGQDFLDDVCDYLNLKLELDGPGVEEMKAIEDKPVMFASNHPYGGPEGLVIFKYIHRNFPRARILIQSFMKFIRPFSEVCVFNKSDIDSLNKAVDEKRPLYFYPAGYCSRILSNGIVFDYDWKSSFVRIAKKNNMPVVIMHTHGQLSDRTLRFTQFRKKLHIKYSIETMFLPDELFKMRNSTLRITCSHVIDPSVFDDSVAPREWAARLRQYCWELKSNPDLVFDPSKPATLPTS